MDLHLIPYDLDAHSAAGHFVAISSSSETKVWQIGRAGVFA
jgi:hypothetical protein